MNRTTILGWNNCLPMQYSNLYFVYEQLVSQIHPYGSYKRIT